MEQTCASNLYTDLQCGNKKDIFTAITAGSHRHDCMTMYGDLSDFSKFF